MREGDFTQRRKGAKKSAKGNGKGLGRHGVCSFILPLAFACGLTLAQESDPYVTNHNLRGVVPFGSFQVDSIDAVNLATGALEVNIPLFERAGRGLDYSPVLSYSSKSWKGDVLDTGTPEFPMLQLHMRLTGEGPRSFQMRGVFGSLSFREDFHLCPDPPVAEPQPVSLRVRSNFTYRSPSGATFRFPNRVTEAMGDPETIEMNCPSILLNNGGANFSYAEGPSDSGSLLLETPPGGEYWVTFKDGSRELVFADGFIRRRVDSNGNRLEGITDTLGRSYPESCGFNCSISLQDSQGAFRSFSWGRGSLSISPQFSTQPCQGYPVFSGSAQLDITTRLDLPNGLAYTFQYDPVFGELKRINLPSGGYIRFEYQTLEQFDQPPGNWPCRLPSRRVVERAVSEDGTAASEKAWTYSYAFTPPPNESYTTTVTHPEGNVSVHLFDSDGIHELETERKEAGGAVRQRVTNTWQKDLGPVASPNMVFDNTDDLEPGLRNWRITEELTELLPANLLSKRTTQYDSYTPGWPGFSVDSKMNVVREESFDFGAGAAGPLLRAVEAEYLHDDDPLYDQAHIWDRPSLQTVLDADGGIASQTRTSYDDTSLTPSTAIQHEDPGPLRGNPTTVERWLNTESRWISSQSFFDQQGNLVQMKDPKGFDTFFGYADDWEASPACPPPGQTRAFATSTTNHLGHAVSRSHYSCSSLTQSVTDANGRSFSFEYDLLDRLKRVDSPDGGEHVRFYSDVASDLSAQRSGQPVFRDGGTLPLRSKSFTLIESGMDQVDLRILDGLGRIEFQAQKNGAVQGLQQFDYVMTGYDGNGRVSSTSNPLSLADFSDLPNPFFFSAKTRTFYDALDRVVEVEAPDGQSVLTAYSGNQTTVTDPAGASIRSTADALGRIVQAREPDPSTGSLDSGGFSDTLYSYDPLDNLTGVLQGFGGVDQDGSAGDGITQSRSFLYDSLGRLIQESHPESGTAGYAYDDNGNLVEKVDARGRKAENDYDALNRLVSTSYSVEGDPSRTDPTPPVSYLYDGSTSLNRRGRLRSVTDGAGASTFEYDAAGRISRSVRTTRGKTLTADYSYTFLGGVKTASYQGVSPSGYTLVYGYDEQGRQTGLSDGGGTQFVTGYRFEHFTFSSLEQTFYGNGVEESIKYNKRLQPESRTVYDPSRSKLMELHYEFDTIASAANNGNISAIHDLLTGEARIFLYDKLNRLTDVSGTPWGIDYSYDRFGNRLSAVAIGSPPNFQGTVLGIDPSTNRIVDSGWEYDAAGNVVEDGGLHHFRWDSASRLIELGPPQPSGSGPPGDDGRCNGEPGCPPPPPPPPDPDPPLDDGRSSGGFKAQAAGTMLYEYDYQGRRVVKDEGGTGRIYFWDEVLGEVIWEFPLEAPATQDVVRGFLNGRLVVENDTRPGGGLHFMHRDHLGTSKLMTDFFSGAKVCDEVYHPFGQLQSQQPSGCNGHVRKFTGKERDSESGMDYFGARYSDSILGRFMSADPLLESADRLDPQTWNRFAYVRNNPLRHVDPNGEGILDVVEGVGNGILSSFFFGPRTDGSTQSRDFVIGQAIGDTISGLAGSYIGAYGTTRAIGGGLLTAGSGGTGSPISVPATVTGAGLAVLGGVVVVNSADNLGESLAHVINSVSESGGSRMPKPGDFKALSKKEVKSFNIHKLKESVVGKENISKVNLVKDRNGRLIVVPRHKTPGGVVQDTGYTLEEAIKLFPIKK